MDPDLKKEIVGLVVLAVVGLVLTVILAFKAQASEPDVPAVCVILVRSFPESAMVDRVHLGKMQTYVAEVPLGWPLPREVTRWPLLVSGSCDDLGTCAWTDVREGEDCSALRVLPQYERELYPGESDP